MKSKFWHTLCATHNCSAVCQNILSCCVFYGSYVIGSAMLQPRKICAASRTGRASVLATESVNTVRTPRHMLLSQGWRTSVAGRVNRFMPCPTERVNSRHTFFAARYERHIITIHHYCLQICHAPSKKAKTRKTNIRDIYLYPQSKRPTHQLRELVFSRKIDRIGT